MAFNKIVNKKNLGKIIHNSYPMTHEQGGYLYIAINYNWKKRLKVGCTNSLRSLYKERVPWYAKVWMAKPRTIPKVILAIEVKWARHALEQIVIKLLGDYRNYQDGNEYFKMSHDDAISVVREIAERYNAVCAQHDPNNRSYLDMCVRLNLVKVVEEDADYQYYVYQ